MNTRTRLTMIGVATAAALGMAQAAFAAKMPDTVFPFPQYGTATQSWVQHALKKKGFTDIGRVSRHGNYYLTTAMWGKKHVGLSINRLDGGISSHNIG